MDNRLEEFKVRREVLVVKRDLLENYLACGGVINDRIRQRMINLHGETCELQRDVEEYMTELGLEF